MPLSDTPSAGEEGFNKGVWMEQEDARLLEAVRTPSLKVKGVTRLRTWNQLAVHAGTRVGKQCRERWHNHLDPSLNHEPFTPEEDAVIVNTYLSLGSKWSAIAALLNRRTDNQVKNHFHSTILRRGMDLLRRAQSDGDLRGLLPCAKRRRARAPITTRRPWTTPTRSSQASAA